MRTITGLQRLENDQSIQDSLNGNIGLLCHAASVTSNFKFAPDIFKDVYGDRFKKLFGPQHGFVTDVQDNMIETKDYVHPYYKVPVHSLYGEVRWPTEDMLSGLDTLVIDLQDVGTRVYTYIWTLSYILEKCENTDIEIVVLDRPNPVNGVDLEGTILNKEFASFVGRDEILHRHGLTIGEFGHWFLKHNNLKTKYRVIEMLNWKREYFYEDTGLPWVNPSPNLPLMDSSIAFIATVMLEGTNLSEGRGTTRPLEFIGHPDIEPHSFIVSIQKLPEYKMVTEGIILRPTVTLPMFQKHAQKPNGGLFFQTIDAKKANYWRCGLFLIREFAKVLGEKFEYKIGDYEYEFDKNAFDLINGSEFFTEWVNRSGDVSEILEKERSDIETWKETRKDLLLY
jgi:uncharacterized protein YbbC (DUF1343 family)